MSRNVGAIALVAIGAIAWACHGQVDMGALAGDAGGSQPGDGRGTGEGSSGGADTMPDATVSLLQDAQACPPIDEARSCVATCCTPAGTIRPFTSAAEVYSAVFGRWQFCSGLDNWHGIGAPGDAIGVEFAAFPIDITICKDGGTRCPSGDMYFLVQGPSGPVRGSGFAYQWTYDVSPEGGSGSYYQFSMHPAPNGGQGSSLLYSPCPEEIEFAQLGYKGGGTVVRFY
jgi:hypothetical protein